ncbi:MAG: antibiotic biosynthesis monooxygenase [Desulfobacter sp.]|nr:MAG: antibiotic biosynthesis monooxygenase [Desulfobacter sp.]
MIHVLASIKVKEEFLDAFIDIFKANVPHVLKEKGCLGYEPAKDLPTGLPIQETDSTIVTIIEKWESPEALKAHLAAPHMVEYQKKTKDMVAGVSVKILEPV